MRKIYNLYQFIGCLYGIPLDSLPLRSPLSLRAPAGNDKCSGFTILEVLLTLAIFIIITAVTVPSVSAWRNSASISTVEAEIKQAFYLAKARSVSGKNNSNHGVCFVLNSSANSALSIYQGNSYSTRNSDYDIELDFGNGIILTSTNDTHDINFTKNNGESSVTTTITISDESTTDEKNVVINELGIVK